MKKLFFLLAILVAFPAFADKTVYIRTDCANDGDGTTSSCAAGAGLAGAHKTCQEAETDEQAANANVVTAGFGNLVFDAAGTVAETAECNFSGFTTDSTHKIILRGDFSTGSWNTSQYRFQGTFGSGGIRVEDQYVEIDKVQVYNTGTGSGNYHGVRCAQSEGGLYLKVTNSLLRGAASTGNPVAGIYFRPDVANAVGYFANNIVYGFSGTNTDCYRLEGSGYNNGELIVAYNNTCHGAATGFRTHGGGSSDALYLRNNITQSNTTGYNIGPNGAHATNTNSTNLSEDTSSPNNTWDSLAVSFVSETGGSEDLHLQSGDTAAKDQGTDLSGDAQYAFSTDIDGATRSGTWDIGADEVTGGGADGSEFETMRALGLY